MPVFTVPIHESNDCHAPAGSPEGGQFCSQGGGVNTPAFKAWFKGSKIVDASGNPLRVFHGTPSRGSESNNRYVRSEQADVQYPVIDEFDTGYGGITDSGWLGRGTYFTPDPDYAYEFGDRLMPVYLSIQNPFEIQDDSSASLENNFQFLKSLQGLKGLPDSAKIDLTPPTTETYHNYEGTPMVIEYELVPNGSDGWSLLSRSQGGIKGTGVVEASGKTKESTIFAYRYKDTFNWFLLKTISQTIGAGKFTELLQQNGYDGVVAYENYKGKPEVKEVVAFYPKQIKSAIGNRGTFDPRSNKITERR